MIKIILIILAISISACTTMQDVDELIMSGEAEAIVFKIKYTETEEEAIRQAISQYYNFHNKWKPEFSSQINLLKNTHELLYEDYEKLRERYFEIERIVSDNFHRYNQETQKEILNLENQAKELDRSMRVSRKIGEVATFGEVVARMATKML